MRHAVRIWILLSLAGCATIRADQMRMTEQVLAAAGFRSQAANTPAAAARFGTLPPGKLVLREQSDGTRQYVYADDTVCKCVWVGTPQEFEQYRKLVARQRAADKAAMVENEASNPWDWTLWGTWPK
jgi:hypothetical protein